MNKCSNIGIWSNSQLCLYITEIILYLQSCVKNLNELLQSKIHTSCLSAKEAGSDEYDAFWENLEEICGDKNFVFEKPQCPLDQPDEDEVETCSECDGVPEMVSVVDIMESIYLMPRSAQLNAIYTWWQKSFHLFIYVKWVL